MNEFLKAYGLDDNPRWLRYERDKCWFCSVCHEAWFGEPLPRQCPACGCEMNLTRKWVYAIGGDGDE